eukprot:scaffold23511_cov68-Cyclotella_meneghiniana.AAC.1
MHSQFKVQRAIGVAIARGNEVMLHISSQAQEGYTMYAHLLKNLESAAYTARTNNSQHSRNPNQTG